jgi:membrane-bound serine protease (ClpP class)
MEQIGSWLNAISPLLLIIGILGLYAEFQHPGFGLPGIGGISAFVLYFLGGYIAGLSGLEWVIVFIIGLALILVDLFVYPGTFLLGLTGAGLILLAIIMAMVDLYPNPGPSPGLPKLPSFDVFSLPIRQLVIALAGTAVGIWVLSRILPKTPLYRMVVSTGASGTRTEAVQEQQRSARLGQVGTALSTLRPGGKAQFGEEILDVMTQGELLIKGTKVRIIRHSGTEAVVEAVGS